MRRFLTLAAAAGFALVWLADRPPAAYAPPFRAQYLDARGLRLRAAVGGTGDPVIVLLHGYAESALAWRAVASGLVADFRVAALDLPGHGLSSKPATGYSIDGIGEAVALAITGLSDTPVVLVGHSMGGAVAVWVAAWQPALVGRLVLIDAAGLPGPVLSSVASRSAGAVATLVGAGAAVRAPHDPRWLEEGARESSYQPSADPAYYDALQAILREFDFAGLDSLLPRVHQPTLVIWGEHDALTPIENAEHFDSRIEDSRLVVIEDALHRPHTTHPSQVGRLVREFALSRYRQKGDSNATR